MSERGVFAVDRGVWDHPMFASRDPFSRREAWIWLISEAAWKVRRRRVGSIFIELARGEIAHSIRFIADAWGWPKSNVARFLKSLETETMIGTRIDQGVTVITICNYDDYQRVSLPDKPINGTEIGTRTGQERDTDGTLTGQRRDKLEDIEDIKGIESPEANASGASAPRADPRTRLFREGLSKLAELTGRGPDACRSFVGKCLKEVGDDALEVLAAIEEADRNRVVNPSAWIAARLKGKGTFNGRRTVHDAARDLAERLNAFDEPAPSGLCGGQSEDVVRLLPAGRR